MFWFSARTSVRWLVLSIQHLSYYIYPEVLCASELSVQAVIVFVVFGLFGMIEKRTGYSAAMLIMA